MGIRKKGPDAQRPKARTGVGGKQERRQGGVHPVSGLHGRREGGGKGSVIIANHGGRRCRSSPPSRLVPFDRSLAHKAWMGVKSQAERAGGGGERQQERKKEKQLDVRNI